MLEMFLDRLKALPRSILVIIGVYLVLGVFYAHTTPLFEKPDENWHFAMAMYLVDHRTLPQNTPDAPVHYAQQQANQAPFYYLTLSAVLRLTGYHDLTAGYHPLVKVNEGVRTGDKLQDNDNQRFYISGRCEGACEHTASAVKVGRGLSVFYVGVGLLFIGLTMRLIFPNKPAFWMLTTALVAFNPQVLHLASSVSNDGLTILLMSLGCYLVARWIHGERSARMVILMGVVAGLALLTKVSAAALGLVIGLLLLWRSQQRLRDLVLLGVSSMAMCSWWLIYNLRVYGELTGVETHMNYARFPGMGQTPIRFAEPLPLSEIPRYLGRIISSFWAEFGWGQIILSEGMINGMIVFIVGSLTVGALMIAWKWRLGTPHQRLFGLFLGGLLAVVTVLYIRWMTIIEAPHGRLLFPAIVPLALVMAWGLIGWIPTRWRAPISYAWVAVLALQAFWMPLAFVIPAYAVSPPLVEPEAREVGITFAETDGGRVTVRDVVLIVDEGLVNVQITWEIETALEHDYLVFVHLLNQAGEIVAQRDSYPMLSNRPLTRLTQGETLDDVYPMRFSGELSAVRLGMYEYGQAPNTWHRVPVESVRYVVTDDAVVIPIADLRVVQR